MTRLFLLALMLFSDSVLAQTADAAPSEDMVLALMNGAMTKINPILVSKALLLLSALMTLQFVITNLKLLFQGADLEAVFAKFIGLIAWFGVCFYILDNAPAWIERVAGSFLTTFDAFFPSVGGILLSTAGITTGMVVLSGAVGFASATIGQFLLVMTLMVLFLGITLAGKLVLLKIELAMVVFTAPLSFSFLALNALRDQGIAPFKSLISLIYRIVVYAVICAAFAGMSGGLVAFAQKYGSMSGNVFDVVANGAMIVKAMVVAFFMQGVLLIMIFKADSIAASLASGSTSMSTADMTGGVMAAAATGAMLGSMAANVQNGAKNASEMLKDVMGGQSGMDMRNASNPEGSLPASLEKPSAGQSQSEADSGDNTSSSASPSQSEQSTNPNPDYPGTPNQPSSPGRDVERDAAREARRQARQGTGQDAAINGNGNNSSLSSKKVFGDHLRDVHSQQDKASTHVSINTHHD